MVKYIETTGRSEEDAIAAALFQLGLERYDVTIEVMERAKSGFLGFGGNPARVRVGYEEENGKPVPMKDIFQEELFAPKAEEKPAPEVKPEPKPAPQPKAEQQPQQPEAVVEEETILMAKPGWEPPKRRERSRSHSRGESRLQEGDEVIIGRSEPKSVSRPEQNFTPVTAEDEKAQKIAAFLSGLMEHLDVEATPEIFVGEEGGYKVILQGEGLGAIIGRRGETLDAIQQLTSYAINHGQSRRVRIHVDAENYRAKREETLQRLAVKVAGKVTKYRKNITLEPMNAYERHVIHTALQDHPNVSTYSTGVEPNRRTVVAYAPGKK